MELALRTAPLSFLVPEPTSQLSVPLQGCLAITADHCTRARRMVLTSPHAEGEVISLLHFQAIILNKRSFFTAHMRELLCAYVWSVVPLHCCMSVWVPTWSPTWLLLECSCHICLWYCFCFAGYREHVTGLTRKFGGRCSL